MRAFFLTLTGFFPNLPSIFLNLSIFPNFTTPSLEKEEENEKEFELEEKDDVDNGDKEEEGGKEEEADEAQDGGRPPFCNCNQFTCECSPHSCNDIFAES